MVFKFKQAALLCFSLSFILMGIGKSYDLYLDFKYINDEDVYFYKNKVYTEEDLQNLTVSESLKIYASKSASRMAAQTSREADCIGEMKWAKFDTKADFFSSLNECAWEKRERDKKKAIILFSLVDSFFIVLGIHGIKLLRKFFRNRKYKESF